MINFQKLIFFEVLFLMFVCLLSLLTFFKNDPKETIELGFGEKAKKNNNTFEKKKEIDDKESKESKKSKI